MAGPASRTLPLLMSLLLAACGAREPAGWSGYAEADYVYVASPLAGTLQTLAVEAGQQVQRGKPLFGLELEAERAAREEAAARVNVAQFQANDTDKGKR